MDRSDDKDKRYYSPTDEPFTDGNGDDNDNGKEDFGHYFSPLDESAEDENVLPFSHVDLDEFDDFDESVFDSSYASVDEPSNDPSADDPEEYPYDVGDESNGDLSDGMTDGTTENFAEETADDFAEEADEDHDEVSDVDELFEDEFFGGESSDDQNLPASDGAGEDHPDYDGADEDFTEEEIESVSGDLSVYDPADGGAGVFDKKSEFLFSDGYPEEPELLGRISDGDAADGQISFADLGEERVDEPFIVRESFFDKRSDGERCEKDEPVSSTTAENDAECEQTEPLPVYPDADDGEDTPRAEEPVEFEDRSYREEPYRANKEREQIKKDDPVKRDVRSEYMFIEDENMPVAKIMVMGVGGAGNNAVNRMIEKNVNTATFVALNTDRQALLRSKCPVENRFQIGVNETKGLGAGSNPEVGERAAEESRELIEQLVDGVDLLFIAAGMGGGTGTGAAPVIAKIAREKGCVTVAVVTKPFNIEGRKRAMNAEKGIANLKKYVDTIIIIPNDKLMEALRPDTPLVEALLFADDTLRQGICGIADLIATNALINLDFADVRTVLKDQGLAHMGIGRAKGENRVMEAVKDAVSSPLLETTIEGARGIILNVTGGEDMTLGQVYDASKQVQDIVDPSANIILGMNIDKNLSEELVITLIATGFDHADDDEEEDVETAQARAYKNLFTKKEEITPEENIVSDPAFIEPEEEAEEEPETPKKDLPAFMKRLFKK